MNVLMLGPITDQQTGMYIMYAFNNNGDTIKGVDTREIITMYDKYQFPMVLNNELDNLDFTPDLVLILKGLEFDLSMLRELRTRYPNAKLANWFFDKYLELNPIYETPNYFSVLKEYDYYFCSLEGVADKLIEKGFDNVYYLPEACDPDYHGEQILNSYQEEKYGSDVVFIGTLGFELQHPERIETLKKIVSEGFDLKIWGSIVGDKKKIPEELWDAHALESVINERHSIVCQASNVVVGVDQDSDLALGFSARLYRVLCAGGLYLTNYSVDLEDVFVINKKDEVVSSEQELVVYYDNEDLVRKLDFLLDDKNKSIIDSIKRNGQNKILEEHTFDLRIKKMIDLIGDDK